MLTFGKGFRRLIFYTAAVLVSAVLALPFLIEPLINTNASKKRIAGLIREKIGVEIAPDQMSFHLSPHFQIDINNFETDLFSLFNLHIKGTRISLDGLELIRGKTVVRRIRLNHPDISMLPAALPDKTNGPFTFEAPPLEDLVKQLFDMLPASQDQFELQLDHLSFDYFKTMDARLLVSRTQRNLIFNTEIHGLLLPKTMLPASDGLKAIYIDGLSADFARMSLRVSETSGIQANIRCTPLTVLSEKLKTPVACDVADLEFSLLKGRMTGRIKPMTFSYPQSIVGVEFFNDPGRQDVRLIFKGQDINIFQGGEAALSVAGSNHVVKEIFNILRKGKARNIEVAFRNKSLDTLFDGEQMILKGNAENAVVKIPETSFLAKEVTGSARIENGILSIAAQKGRVAKTMIRDGRLDVHLINDLEDIPFKGVFDLSSDLAAVPRILSTLFPGTRLAEELARVTDVEGRLNARLGLEMKSGDKVPRVTVLAENLNGLGQYNRLPFPVSVTGGRFWYENNTVTLTNCSGRIGSNSIHQATAFIDFEKNNHTNLNISSADLKIQEIFPWLVSHKPVKKLFEPIQFLKGKVAIKDLEVSGPALEPENWQYKIQGRMGNVDVGFKEDIWAIGSLAGSFNLNNRMISARDLEGQINDLTWLGKKVPAKQTASVKLPVMASKGQFKTTPGHTSFSSRFLFDEGVELAINLGGKTFGTMMPKMAFLKENGSSNAMVIYNWTPGAPLLHFEGKLDTRTLGKMIRKNSYLDQLLISLTDGDPIKIYTDNSSNLHIKTGHINLNTLASPVTAGDQYLFARKTMYIETDRLILGRYKLAALAAKVAFSDKKTEVRSFKADLCGMDISGNLTQSRNDSKQIQTRIRIRADGRQDIRETFSCLFPEQKLIEGPFSFTCDLEGSGPKEQILDKLNGSISLKAADGRIYKLTLLSRLLSVLNILNFPDLTQEGFGYKSLTMKGTITDGVIHLEKAFIDADDMALTFKGWVAPFKDDMDLTCLVAPFKTIDTIIKYIPIVNTMLQGSLISLPAKASGSLNDPVIIPLHPSAVGEGLINMMTDIIKSPVRIIESTGQQSK